MPQSTINLAQTTKRPLHEVLVIELALVSDTHILQLDIFELKRTLGIWLNEMKSPLLYPKFRYNRLVSKVTRINYIMQCQLLYTDCIIEKSFFKYITSHTYEARSAHLVHLVHTFFREAQLESSLKLCVNKAQMLRQKLLGVGILCVLV